MSEKDSPETNELQIIFSAEKVKVGDKEFEVKPWTLRQMVQVWPLMTQALNGFEIEGATAATFIDKILEHPQQLITALLPHITPIFIHTFGITEEEAGDLDIGAVTLLTLKILSKNVNHLKNLFALAMNEMKTMMGSEG